MNCDEQYMRRALQLAEKGVGSVAPNPLVGAVIVHEGTIIGEGYHKQYGGPHAEVHAIHSVQNKELLPHSTMYVTLEPCAHFGKTPPCAELLVQHRLKRVVIAMKDPFSLVDGKGIQLLKDNGIDVSCGILEQEARELNKRFLTFHQQKRPYITLKWAQTSDGFLAPITKENKQVFWISQPDTKVITHQLRATEQAILVGWKTIMDDNPSLTTRDFPGNDPLRIVIDPRLQAPLDSVVFTDGKPTLVFNQVKQQLDESSPLKFYRLDSLTIDSILQALYDLKIQSVLVEGGAITLSEFIKKGVWDEALIIQGKQALTKGISAPVINQTPQRSLSFGKDLLLYYKNRI